MLSKTLLPALALAALVVSGCGGGAPAPTSSPVAPASSAADAAPSASSTTATAAIKDPCSLLDARQIAGATGVAVKTGTPSTVGTSKLCSWLPEDTTKKEAAELSAQEGPLPGPLSLVEGQLKSQFGGSVSTVTVAGADDARYVTGKKSQLNVIDVLAQKDGVFYQVLVASPRAVDQHKAGTIKLVEVLIKG